MNQHHPLGSKVAELTLVGLVLFLVGVVVFGAFEVQGGTPPPTPRPPVVAPIDDQSEPRDTLVVGKAEAIRIRRHYPDGSTAEVTIYLTRAEGYGVTSIDSSSQREVRP